MIVNVTFFLFGFCCIVLPSWAASLFKTLLLLHINVITQMDGILSNIFSTTTAGFLLFWWLHSNPAECFSRGKIQGLYLWYHSDCWHLICCFTSQSSLVYFSCDMPIMSWVAALMGGSNLVDFNWNSWIGCTFVLLSLSLFVSSV